MINFIVCLCHVKALPEAFRLTDESAKTPTTESEPYGSEYDAGFWDL